MYTSVPLIYSLLGALVHAQSAMDAMPGIPMACENGYTPSFTCDNPTPDICTCICRDGATFNQSRPGNIARPPSIEEPPQQLPNKPCTADIIIGWTQISLPHKAHSYEPSEMSDHEVDLQEDSIVFVADSVRRCQHFEVFFDGEKVGETKGTGPLDNSECGTPENCMDKHEGSRGYFTIPKGKHTIGLRWFQITDACKHYKNGAGSFQVFKKC